jgi:hypothetical protein
MNEPKRELAAPRRFWVAVTHPPSRSWSGVGDFSKADFVGGRYREAR